MANVNDMADVIWTDPGVGQNYVRMADVLRQNDLGKQAAIYQNLQRNQEIAAAERNAEALRGLQAGQLGETSRQANLQAELYRENLKNQLEIAKLRPLDRYNADLMLGGAQMTGDVEKDNNTATANTAAANRELAALEGKLDLDLSDLPGWDMWDRAGKTAKIMSDFNQAVAGLSAKYPGTMPDASAINPFRPKTSTRTGGFKPVLRTVPNILKGTTGTGTGAGTWTGTGNGTGIGPDIVQKGQMYGPPPPPPGSGSPPALTIADKIKQLDDQFNSGQLSRADFITALQGLKTNAPTTVPSAPVGSSFWNRIMGALGQSGIIGAPQ